MKVTAAILIIGNEILSGRTQDTNTNWYPDAILIRQNKIFNWKEPIQELLNIISIN